MDLQKQLKEAAVEQIKQHFHNLVGSIRDPDTGAFATLWVKGDTLDGLSLQIEGSPALLELVRQRLGAEADDVSLVPVERAAPQVFLSYTTADAALAERIARALMDSGIQTWWAQWEIRGGDSLRQKIEEGLGSCTHFLVLLTPNSLAKPWVNAELDAAFVRKLGGGCRLIPIRHGVDPKELSPFLQALRSLSIDADASDVRQIINDIHGVSEKPPLGCPPEAVRDPSPTRYSAAATAVARVFVEASEHGTGFDPQISLEDLCEKTGLTNEDLDDAIHELGGMVKETFGTARPERDLFAEFDRFWKPWNPADDALLLAADMVNSPEFPGAMSKIAERLGWPARRLNSAASYLIRRRLVDFIDTLDCRPFTAYRITRTDATRRFVKSRRHS